MEREELHHRQIDLRFYRRADGLYEVVGHLVDTKSHAIRRQLAQSDTPAGTRLHDIAVHLVVDAQMLVHDAFATLHATPYAICPGASSALGALKGLSMRKGWNRETRRLLGGATSCTHIVELLGPMATTVYQGLAPLRQSDDGQAVQPAVDSCYGYAANRDVVARLWPHLHRPGGTG